MDKVIYVLSGGFASGYRTYVFTGLAAATVIANWSVGDASLHDSINSLWQLLVTGGIAAHRAALAAAVKE